MVNERSGAMAVGGLTAGDDDGVRHRLSARERHNLVITPRIGISWIIHTAFAFAVASGWGAEDRPVDVPANPLEKPGWVLTAHDEFDGPELNTDLWIPYYAEHRTTRERATARYELRDGHLVLRIDQDQPLYFSGGGGGQARQMKVSSVQTAQGSNKATPTDIKFTQQYGYFEIRAKTYRRPGYAAAFWTLGAGSQPGQNAEIDIFEQAGHFRVGGDTFNLYSQDDTKLPKTTRVGQTYGFDPTAGFNIYALDWDEKAIRKFVNNKLVAEIPHSPSYPMFFFLSVYENPGWTGNADMSSDSGYPKEFVIDYFRAYERGPNYKPE